MPKRNEPELHSKEQFKRFKEAAENGEVVSEKAVAVFFEISLPK